MPQARKTADDTIELIMQTIETMEANEGIHDGDDYVILKDRIRQIIEDYLRF